jgi:hypothetical protein
MEKHDEKHRRLRAEAEVPVDLEAVLLRAARDAEFKARLLADRRAAIGEAGIALTDSERALLAAMPAQTLQATVDRLEPKRQRDQRFLRRVGAAALVGGILVASCDGGNDTMQAGGVDSDTDVDTDSDADAGPDAGG